MPETFTTCGKQVLCDGSDFAQAATPEIAERIAGAMGDRASIAAYLDAEGKNKRRSMYFRRLIRVLGDNVRARLDVGEGRG